MKICRNCRYRHYEGWYGMLESCLDYEMACTEAEEIEAARNCERYEEGTPDCLVKDEYCSSATNGDYSPSCPWNAEGMSIKDFI